MNLRSDARDEAEEEPHGVLVVGHGTRDVVGSAEFDEVVRRLVERLAPTPVEPCFLESAEPTIAAGFERLVARGVRRVTVAPLVLFAAGHAKRDIPEAVAAAAVRHPGVAWRQAAHLGLHPRLVELSTLRFDEATAGRPPVAAAETLLIVVGRGSSDPEAAAEARAYAELCGRTGRAGRVETAFAALCRPTPDEVLQSAAAAGDVRRIVVQPHILFSGEVLGKIAGRVAAARSSHTGIEFIRTDRLGPHELVVEAVLERLSAAASLPPSLSSRPTSADHFSAS